MTTLSRIDFSFLEVCSRILDAMPKSDVRVVSLKSGESLDEFKVDGYLGKGLSNKAHVYRMEDGAAIKLYVDNINPAKDNLDYVKFKNEVVLLKKMDGAPNVLKTLTDFREYAIHENEKKLAPYYAMELMDGSLSAIVFSEELDFDKKIKIATQIIQGTLECHEKKICHRDIYTPNILYKEVDGDITCKIADLGSAKLHGAPQPFPYFHPTGLIKYTSPEAAVGLLGGDKPDFEIMKAADIFALGLVLYEVFTGLRQERLNSGLASMVMWAKANGLWDPKVTAETRLDFLNRAMLPQLASITINQVTASDILKGEDIATGVNSLIMSMITLDYNGRAKDLAQVKKGFSALLDKENE